MEAVALSHEATNWASKVRGISPMQKLVLMLMADCHNGHTRECFPSIDTLAEDSCAGRRTVIRAIQALEVAGLISIRKQEGKSNRYDLHTSATVTPVSERHPCQSDTPPVSERHPTRATVTPEQEITGKNRKRKTSSKNLSWDEVKEMGVGVPRWEDWVDHRREKKKPFTPMSVKTQLEELAEFSEAEQEKAIREAIKSGWQGLFPKKNAKAADDNIPTELRYLYVKDH